MPSRGVRKVSAIIYVGKPDNMKADLGWFYPNFKVVFRNAGADGEDVHLWN